ncbi:unnamed protein product [Cuscuta campestris]|uniref:Uncharacterized protein n=1 Tax=Cuscuta campestris TaxID=132261 RepID=A0A484N4Q9_9ASTE|nr:unnamed protein product [Cuscuta campestris]
MPHGVYKEYREILGASAYLLRELMLETVGEGSMEDVDLWNSLEDLSQKVETVIKQPKFKPGRGDFEKEDRCN